MKHIYKHFFAASLLWAGMAVSAQAQFVINYQNEKGAQETATSDLLKVTSNGKSYLVNQIEIHRVNYISRFVSDNTNEGKIDLPAGSNVNAAELMVVGGNSEVKVDDHGNFQTASNNITAYNNTGQVVYRSYVTMESGNQMCSAALNAKETAVSLLLPMFTSIFQGMSDEVMNHIKTMIGELPETKALAEAIDNSIIRNGYLNMDDVSNAYQAAVSEVARLSGLSQPSTARAERQSPSRMLKVGRIGEKVTNKGIGIMLKGLEKTTVNRNNVLGTRLAIDGYLGKFDIWNYNRLSYSEIAVGRKTTRGDVVFNENTEELLILPPVRMGQFVDTNSTWDDIKNYLTGENNANVNAGDGIYSESKVSDVVLKLGSNDDAVFVRSPSYGNMSAYNYARICLAIVVADIIGSTDTELQDQFFKDYYQFFTSYDNCFTEPNSYYPDQVVTIPYLQRFQEILPRDESEQEKILEIFDLMYEDLKIFLEGRGAKYNNAQANKVLENKDFYRAVIAQIGDKSTVFLGLNATDTGIHVEGLDIVQPKLNVQELYSEAATLYNYYVASGNGKMGNYSELFYKGMWLPGLFPTLDTQSVGWDKEWNTQESSRNFGLSAQYYICAFDIVDYANALLADLENSGITTLDVLKGEALALRSFMYMYLVENWGCVVLPDGKQASSDMEVLDAIIADLTKAAKLLNWQPRGVDSCTKGMALSYLGEAYLWKAYRQRANGVDDKACVAAAREALKQVIDSHYYALADSYSSLWGLDKAWPGEAVWQFANEMVTDPGDAWSRQDWTYMQFYAAPPMCGGWGSLFFSWELYFLFEQGDLRRDASFCTAAVPTQPEQYRGSGYGYNPFLWESINWQNYKFDYEKDGTAPAVWTLKYWRHKQANWMGSVYCPVHVYFKRYAGVLLDYAECLFRLNGGDDIEAWGIIDNIRSRAFNGNVPEHAKSYYSRMTKEGLKINLTGTPETLCLPFEGKAEPWQVALGQEKRKEFNCEWNLRADLQRLDFLQAHMDCNYPMNVGSVADVNDWHTPRTWNFNPSALLLPIPE